MPKGYGKHCGALLLLMLLLVSVNATAATRFSVSGLGATGAQPNSLELGILQYAVPSLAQVFSPASAPPIMLTIDNSAGTDSYFQVAAAVYYNRALLASVTFGRHNASAGELVLAGEKRSYRFDATGIRTSSIIQMVQDQNQSTPVYLGDAFGLDVIASEYSTAVLSFDQLEEALIYRNTLPNGEYQVAITLKQSDGSGGWVDVATHNTAFSILETTATLIRPVGDQGRFLPSFLEFTVSGFPAQVACFSAQVELSEGQNLLWQSDAVTIGTGTACQFKAVHDSAYVALPLPHHVQIIGGQHYTWTLHIKDARGRDVAPAQSTRFHMPNTYPEVAILPSHMGASVRPNDNIVFTAQVFDWEDDLLGYATNLTWWVKPPGHTLSSQIGNQQTLVHTFTQQGQYELELRATDRFGAVSSTTLDILVEENQLPQLAIQAIQVESAAQTKNVAWSQKDHLVDLAKQAYQVDDRLIFTFEVTDADQDDVRLVVRNNQTPLSTHTVRGSGTVVAEVVLTQPVAYSLDVELVDSKAGVQSWQLGKILALPSANPVVSIVSPTNRSSYTAGTRITLRAEAYDVNDLLPVVYWYRLHDSGYTELLGTGNNLTYVVLAGEQSIQAQVVAQPTQEGATQTNVGVSTPIALYGHTVPNEKPVVRIHPPPGGLIYTADQSSGNHTVTFQAEASDLDGPKPLTYNWYIKDELIASNTSRVSYTFNGIGVWPVRVVVSDGVDTSSEAVAMVVTSPATFPLQIAPVDGSTLQQRYRQGDVLSLQAQYGEQSDVAIAWQLSGTTSEGISLTKLVTMDNPVQIPLDKAGNFTLEAIALDNKGQRGSAKLSLPVRENQAPEVDYVIWPASIYVGDTFRVSVDPADASSDAYITATDPEGDKIVGARWYLNRVNLGTGLSFPATFSYPGTYVYSVAVTDERGGVGEGTFVIDVISDLQSPQVEIVEPSTPSVPLGIPVSLQAAMNDPEGEGRIVSQTWYIDGQALPPGQNSFIPTQARNYTVTCLAQDRAGNMGGATLAIAAVPAEMAATAAAQILEQQQHAPQIVGINAPWQINPREAFWLQADIVGEPTALYTITWLLQGLPIATGYVQGSGIVRNEVALPNTGTYTITARVEGAQVERSVNVRVAVPKEPTIISPKVPPHSMLIMSGPITFVAVNIPDGAELIWASDVDGILQEHSPEVTATLSPGAHTVTLWIDDVGISVQVLVQPQVKPLQQIGIVTGWSGAPMIVRYDGQVTYLRQGSKYADYSAAQLTLYDVDRLQLGPSDTLQLRLFHNGQEVQYTSIDDGKFIDRWGIPYEPGEQDE